MRTIGTMSHRPELVEAAHQSLADGDWARARQTFAEALAVAETAEALAGLAEAMWWLGEVPEAVEYAERAYAGYHRRGDMAGAIEMALWMALRHHANLGNAAAAAGWLARARTLVTEHRAEKLTGWVRLYESMIAGPVTGEPLARQARDLARERGDSDLELCAISEIGAKLIGQGRLVEGMGFLDEAMAGALAGEGGDPLTVVYTSCNTVRSCVSSAAFERAMQWVRAADRFTRRFGCPFLFAQCRTLYGSVLAAVGDWVQTEQELQTAVRLSRDALPAVHVGALAALADLRLSQGRIEESERLLTGLQDDPAAVAVAARLQLERGRPANAEAMLRRRLAELGDEVLEAFPLRELLGAAALAQGRVDEAADLGRALVAAGERLHCDIAVARGHRLLGLTLATDPAAGRAAGQAADRADDEAVDHLDRALAAFARLRLPLESARTRLHLGRLRAGTVPDVAAEDLQRAFDFFYAVNAAGDAAAAAAQLRQLGLRPARTGTRSLDPLSPREREVFALLGEGLSNSEIAERLYISHRTVEHHVARTIEKLGLRTRGGAVAAAVRHAADPAGPRRNA
jgi:DNA-binding CsgD family transcriptional regulator